MDLGLPNVRRCPARRAIPCRKILVSHEVRRGLTVQVKDDPVEHERVEERIALEKHAANRTHPTCSDRVLGGVHLSLLHASVALNRRFNARTVIGLHKYQPPSSLGKRNVAECVTGPHGHKIFLGLGHVGDYFADGITRATGSLGVLQSRRLEERPFGIKEVESIRKIIEVAIDVIGTEATFVPDCQPVFRHLTSDLVGF